MSLYDNLPVYRAGYSFLTDLFRVITNLPRDYRYSLGDEMKKCVMNILLCIYKANATTEKYDLLCSACDEMLKVKIYLRVLRDLHLISSKTFSYLAVKEDNLSRQLNGWRNKQSPSPPGIVAGGVSDA